MQAPAAIMPALVRVMFCLVALAAAIADVRSAGVEAQLQFHAAQSQSGQWIIADRPQVAPGADAAFTQNLQTVLAGFPAGTISTNAFPMWLAQAYWSRFGVFPATRSAAPAEVNQWTVTVPQLPQH